MLEMMRRGREFGGTGKEVREGFGKETELARDLEEKACSDRHRGDKVESYSKQKGSAFKGPNGTEPSE